MTGLVTGPVAGPGPARTRRLPSIRTRKQRLSLAPGVEHVLFSCAKRISEGHLSEEETAYFGSTMFTISLDALRAKLRFEPQPLLEALDGSARVRLLAMRLSREDAAQHLPGRALGTLTSETRFHLDETAIYIDVDVEIALPMETLKGNSSSRS